MRPTSLGSLRRTLDAGVIPRRSIRDELRDNLIAKLQASAQLFSGIIGYDETVVPQIVNAILSRHNFIILGLRGQAKTRLLRSLVDLLDENVPVIPGCEINDHPLDPVCVNCQERVRTESDDLPIGWLNRSQRYVEKLATPDVTIADMIGDIDPIKAARSGHQLSNALSMHYGLLPRANRCIFAVNELPDLASKIQVGLFNILQEGDVQIKGFPVRLKLDVMMVFTANPEDYTARGKIVSPLKDRIGSEIRTHYPETRQAAIAITEQEAWTGRGNSTNVTVPLYVREVVEEVAFQARTNKKVDTRSGVSQRMPITCLENVVSNAERRAIAAGEHPTARITDIYAALPSITGKFELEYEGEIRGSDSVARELIRSAIGAVFGGWFDGIDANPVVEWFEMGGTVQAGDMAASAALLEDVAEIQGLYELLEHAGAKSNDTAPTIAAAVDFVMEGLCALRKISRNDTGNYQAVEKPSRPTRSSEQFFDQNLPIQPGGKKKYYN